MKGVLALLIVWLRLCAPAARLSLADWNSYNYREPSGPGTYAFGYDIDDSGSGNVQFRNEERHPNGTVTGSYGYVDPEGRVRIVRYIADQRGYRATVEEGPDLSMLKPLNQFPGFQGYPPYRFYFPHNNL
ncbi:larval cuticle protein 1 [Tribolium castaneum]|uniref:larval cuticle protein 1 n=1 Tax=Tribolium castaneum TaxID=7070 RepID=UPI0030FEFB1C